MVLRGGGISNTSPEIRGKTYGLKSTSSATTEFYDGILKGVTAAVNGTITTEEQNSSEATGTETIGSDTYNTLYLVTTP